jgi:hypothetical protein
MKKSPYLLIKLIKKIKALQQNAKGLELASSPYWADSELLIGILQ